MSLRDAFLSSPMYKEMESVLAGGRPLASSSAKRHHFVPAMVLPNFASDDAGSLVYQLDRHAGAPRQVPISRAASRRNLYTLADADGTQHRRIETWLAEVEGHAATAIRALFSDPRRVTRNDAATIAMFIAMLMVRTPAAAEAERKRVDQAMRIKLACRLADPEAFAERGIGDEALRQRTLEGLRDGSVAYPEEDQVGLRTGFDRLGADSQLIYQLQWTLLLTDEGSFITSDRGIAMYDPELPWPWTGNGLNSSPTAETTVPLSSQACLLLTPGGSWSGRAVRHIGRSQVDTVNLRTYGWSDRHLFGENQALLDHVRRQARATPKRVPRPRPVRNVITLPARPGDDQFAATNRRRGWPEQVPIKDVQHDYRVLEIDENPVDVCLDVWATAARRGKGRRPVLGMIPRETPHSAPDGL